MECRVRDASIHPYDERRLSVRFADGSEVVASRAGSQPSVRWCADRGYCRGADNVNSFDVRSSCGSGVPNGGSLR